MNIPLNDLAIGTNRKNARLVGGKMNACHTPVMCFPAHDRCLCIDIKDIQDAICTSADKHVAIMVELNTENRGRRGVQRESMFQMCISEIISTKHTSGAFHHPRCVPFISTKHFAMTVAIVMCRGLKIGSRRCGRGGSARYNGILAIKRARNNT